MGHKTIAASVVTAAGLLTVGMMTVANAGHSNEVLNAGLDGRQQVADGATSKALVGDPNGKGEVYVFGIDGDPTTLCYVLTADKVAELEQAPGNGRAAHIHMGAKGANGPVAVNLAWPQGGQAADCLTEGEAGKFTGVATVQEILANPSAFYVNVHNTEFPSGAIRGQLAPQHGH